MKLKFKTALIGLLALAITFSPITSSFAEEPGISKNGELKLTKIETEDDGTSAYLFDDSRLGKDNQDETIYFSAGSIRVTKGDCKGEVINRITFANHSKDDVFVYIVTDTPYQKFKAGDGLMNFANDDKVGVPIFYEGHTHMAIALPKDTYNNKLWSIGVRETENQDEFHYKIYVEFGRKYKPAVKTTKELDEYLNKNLIGYNVTFKPDDVRMHTLFEKDTTNTYNTGGDTENMKTTKQIQKKQPMSNKTKYIIATAVAVVAGALTSIIVRSRKKKFK